MVIRTLSALIALLLSACLPSPAAPAPASTPTSRPTSASPRFELATYMYALQTKGRIRIGVLDDALPFAGRDANGSPGGFEVDLGRELAKAIFGPQTDPDSVIEWVSVDRSTAVSALTSLQADVAIARLATSDLRAASLDLSEPYFVSGERILVRSSNDQIKDLPDLDTMTVCEQRGSGVAERVIEANPFARTLSLDTWQSCLDALAAGQVDAIGADETVLWGLRRIDPNTKIVGRPLVTERYAIGVKKHAGDRQGFLPFIDGWLAGAIRDGTWARLYAQDITPYSGDRRTSPAP